MANQQSERVNKYNVALRILLAAALSALTLQLISADAFGADPPGVTDFTLAQPGAIEPFDIVSALAPLRGTRIEAGSPPPTVRLPILFEFNSSALRPEGEELLEKLGTALQAPELESFRFAVEGHTDNVGSDGFNMRLSERRATSVLNFLAEQGVPQARLQASGMGEGEPCAENETSFGRQRNRRVEIVNLGNN